MFYYARSDTHYLLYIYDMVRNELISKSDRSNPETDYIGRVLQKSKDLALSRYEHPSFDSQTGEGSRGWYNMILRNPTPLPSENFAVFKAVWKWRDDVARREDESPPFVLPVAVTTDIARVLPPDAKALHALLPNNAYLARANLNELWSVIQNARAEGRNGPSLLQFLGKPSRTSPNTRAAIETPSQSIISTTTDDGSRPASLSVSQLFGTMAISSLWEEAAASLQESKDYIILPWQRFIQNASSKGGPADLVGDHEDAGTDEERMEVEKPAKVDGPAPDDDGEFTLRRGGKRKAPWNENTEQMAETANSDSQSEPDSSEELENSATLGELEDNLGSGDEILLDDDRDMQQMKIKNNKGRKSSKTAAKRNARGAAATATPEPFDYSKAGSILRADRRAAPEAGSRTFDPYSKTGEDGPKAARKAPPIHGGRSATFKK
jgi:exosome complex exonuclease RRP6